MPNQYDNEANVLAHFETTGPEVYRQTDGEVDYFVAGMGTTGTLMGTGQLSEVGEAVGEDRRGGAGRWATPSRGSRT